MSTGNTIVFSKSHSSTPKTPRLKRTPGNTEPAADRRSISYQRIDLGADWLIEEKGEEPLGLNAEAKACLSLNFSDRESKCVTVSGAVQRSETLLVLFLDGFYDVRI